MENKQQSNGEMKENQAMKKKMVSSPNLLLTHLFAICGLEAENNYLEPI